MKMQGQEVFRRAVRVVVESATATLERAGRRRRRRRVVRARIRRTCRIIEAAANRLGFEPERTLVNIDRYGNTSSASIPLALFEAVDDGRVQRRRPRAVLRLRRGHDVGAARCCAGARVSDVAAPRSGRVRHRRVARHRPRDRARARARGPSRRLLLLAPTPTARSETRDAVEPAGGKAVAVRADVADADAVDAAFGEIESRVRAGHDPREQRGHHARRAASSA